MSETDTDAALEFLSTLDPDDYTQTYVNKKGEHETRSHISPQGYGRGLRRLAEEMGCDLLDTTLDDVKPGSTP